MQLQVTLESLIYHTKHKRMIGIQYDNPIVDAIREAFKPLPPQTFIEAYVNQATIKMPNRDSFTINYDIRKGGKIFEFVDLARIPKHKIWLTNMSAYLSLDCCIGSFHPNVLTKEQLKPYYKYCED